MRAAVTGLGRLVPSTEIGAPELVDGVAAELPRWEDVVGEDVVGEVREWPLEWLSPLFSGARGFRKRAINPFRPGVVDGGVLDDGCLSLVRSAELPVPNLGKGSVGRLLRPEEELGCGGCGCGCCCCCWVVMAGVSLTLATEGFTRSVFLSRLIRCVRPREDGELDGDGAAGRGKGTVSTLGGADTKTGVDI